MALRGVVVVLGVLSFLASSVRLGAQTSLPTGVAAPRAARFVEELRSSDPARQRAALQEIASDRSIAALDEDVLAALKQLAMDGPPEIQREIARSIGQRVWGAREKQDVGAIALMCQIATTSEDRDARYNAVYYGLSTVREQTDGTLAALMSAGARMVDYDPNLHGRIAWGIKATPPEKIMAACEPYWTPEKVEADPRAAWVLYQTFKEATGKEPPQAERFAAVKEKVDRLVAERKAAHAKLIPELSRELIEGNSARRTTVMQRIYATPYLLFDLDDSILDAFFVAAGDQDWRVRWEVARMTGNRWVWGAEKPHPKAIELALRLRSDPQERVRGFAVYFGLSTIHEPSDTIIKALLDSALGEFRTNDVGRIAWGLRRVKADRLLPFFEPYFDKAKEDPATAAAALKLYTDATGGPPPRPPQVQQAEAGAKSYKAAFNELHAHLGRIYPAFEIKKIDWKKVGEELLPRADDVKDDPSFGLLCLELVARLEDSHAQLLAGTARIPDVDFPRFDPGFACLIDDRDRPVVYYVDRNAPAEEAGVKIGMTIVSVNGRPAAEAMKKWMDEARKYSGYSSERYLRYDAARGFYRQMKKGDPVVIEAETPAGEQRKFHLNATHGIRYLPRLPVPIADINDSGGVEAKVLEGGDVGYIYVRRIRGDLPGDLDKAMESLGDLDELKGLIIDVRGNSGGGFDGQRAFRNFDPDDPAEPQRPRYGGRIALLIDERCVSAGEGWSSWFFAKRRARAFGTTTAGASSRKEEYTLANGLYKVVVPVKAYAGFLDRPIERRGLEPDVEIRCTAADLAAGKDTVLEAARAWLREAR